MSKSNDTTKTRELTAAELDEVTGGFFGRLLSGYQSGGGQGGQNDPAQMFLQIVQQLEQISPGLNRYFPGWFE
jgi:hypothetical protein